ncbi:DNA double-strand break repair nuclease NurA [Candidatus Woesearchaeota archaeon]|nr:DNA double-strand break repair nuclease NurA [Candidatus Woesearchaeota archaeon]
MQEIFNKIISLVKTSAFDSKDTCVKFSDPNYRAFPFDRNNFHYIGKANTNNKIAFIDGGSSEIIKSANFSLNMIRVYYSIFQNNKRIKSNKKEFYAFTNAIEKDNEIYYNTEIISRENIIPDKNDLLLSSFDETIKQGITRANISNVSNLIRRFSELKIAENIIDTLEKEDIIVLDGSLQCTFTNEKKYMNVLFEKAIKKGIIISGLSKTTTLMTDKGNSITNALNNFKIEGKWHYNPVAEIKSNEHKADMSFAKLHEKARHIFRLEIYKEQKDKLNEVISLLSDNAKDPVFIGYPYGLIDADKNARISNNEKDMLKTFFSVKFGKDWEKIAETLTSIDAHEVLDRVER